MAGYLVRRVLWAAVLFLVLTWFTFVIYFVVPGAGKRATQFRQGTQLQIHDQLQLTGPLLQQYGAFLRTVATHGSLGRSSFNRQPVNTLVLNSASVTACVVIGGMLLGLLIAVPIGILSAMRPRSKLDRAGMTFVLLGISVHPAFLAIMFASVFAHTLHVLPNAGYCNLLHPTLGCGGPREWTTHLILPWLTFALPFAAVYTRMIRAYLIEALGEDHVQMARAKGASEARIVRDHALRPVLPPMLSMVMVDAGTAFVGATAAGTIAATLFVERVYGLPGLGTLLVNAADRLDLPVMVGITVFVTTLIVLLMLAADVLTGVLDPRIRAGMASGVRLPRLARRRVAQEAAGPSQPAQTFS